MGLSNAEKQRRHRQRLREKGLVHIQAWARPEQAQAIKAILADQAVTYPPSSKVAGQGTTQVTPNQEASPASPKLGGPALSNRQAKRRAGRTVSKKTLEKWSVEAEKRTSHGLTAILDYLGQHGHEELNYAGIRALLSEGEYKVACRAEIRRLREQGLSWVAVGKVLNERGVPLPAGKGRWTGPKTQTLAQL